MTSRTRRCKILLFILCNGILLSVECPSLVVSSVKTGIYQWVSGSASSVSLSALSDLIIGGFTGGTGAGS